MALRLQFIKTKQIIAGFCKLRSHKTVELEVKYVCAKSILVINFSKKLKHIGTNAVCLTNNKT